MSKEEIRALEEKGHRKTSADYRRVKPEWPDKAIKVSDLAVGDRISIKYYSKHVYKNWCRQQLVVNRLTDRGAVVEHFHMSEGRMIRGGHIHLIEDANSEYQIIYRI